jgi:hypothetical protein
MRDHDARDRQLGDQVADRGFILFVEIGGAFVEEERVGIAVRARASMMR